MTPQSRPSTPQRPAIVGHRGASVHAPENTLAAFRRAIEDGAQLLECDVHLSADGHVVVMHDRTIDRTAAADSPLRSGAIGELTRAELDRVLLGEGERVPSLEELLAMTRPAVHRGQGRHRRRGRRRAPAGAAGRLPGRRLDRHLLP